MHSATTKALLLQIAHRDRHVFLIQPAEDNHCSLEKNVQKLTHTSSKGFYPRDQKILEFLRQALPTKSKKKKTNFEIQDRWSISITYRLYSFNIYLESTKINLPSQQRPLLLKNVIYYQRKPEHRTLAEMMTEEHSINCNRRGEKPNFRLFFVLFF